MTCDVNRLWQTAYNKLLWAFKHLPQLFLSTTLPLHWMLWIIHIKTRTLITRSPAITDNPHKCHIVYLQTARLRMIHIKQSMIQQDLWPSTTTEWWTEVEGNIWNLHSAHLSSCQADWDQRIMWHLAYICIIQCVRCRINEVDNSYHTSVEYISKWSNVYILPHCNSILPMLMLLSCLTVSA